MSITKYWLFLIASSLNWVKTEEMNRRVCMDTWTETCEMVLNDVRVKGNVGRKVDTVGLK